MLRPLITFIIEYILFIIILTKGKYHKYIFASILFLLATYQLGEFIIFQTNGNEIGFKIAYVATTLLPPLGVLLIQKISKRQIGYVLFQTIAIIFSIIMIIKTPIANAFEIGPYCIRVYEYNDLINRFWFKYYQGTLTFSILCISYFLFALKDKFKKSQLLKLLLAYLSFDGLAILLLLTVPAVRYSSASLMCALAIIASFIFSSISLRLDFKYRTLSQNIQKLLNR